MKVCEILGNSECLWEMVYVVEGTDDIIEESAIRQWKRQNGKLIQKYRCMAGKKKGKLVASPSACGERKDPKKVRTGRKVMRSKKGIIGRKAKISKRQSISKRLTKMNARLMGKTT